jgi:hypothetical protein
VSGLALRRRRAAGCAGALGLLLIASAGAAEPSEAQRVRAELAPAVVGLDELATLELEVSRPGFGLVGVEPEFRLENLELAGGPSTSQSQSWINGRTSSSTRLVWRLRPLAEGRAAVRDVRVTVRGATVSAPDQEIEVVRSAPPGRSARPAATPADPFEAFLRGEDPLGALRRPAAPARAPKVHLTAELDRAVAFAGEQVVWRLVLATQADIGAFNPRALPDFQGFWSREIPRPAKLRPEWIEIDGERYGRVVMLERALYPLRTGRVRIGPATADLVVRVAEAGLLGPLARDHQMALGTGAVELEVREPPPAPAGFSGVVGPLELGAELDRARIEVGHAATLLVSAAGFGNLQGLAAPELDLPSGLRAFEPRPESATEEVGGRLRSTVTWRYVLTADRPGDYRLPPVRLTWFDPQGGDYRSSESPSRTLAVSPAPALAQAPESAPERPQRTQAGAGPAAARGRSRALLLGGLAVAALAGAGAARRALLRRRPKHAARRRLEAALAAARAEPSPRLAAADLEEAWRALAAERWAVPPGQPVAHWRESLVRAGVPDGRARALVELFEELHFLRYAPELSNVEASLEDVLERSARLLRELA